MSVSCVCVRSVLRSVYYVCYLCVIIRLVCVCMCETVCILVWLSRNCFEAPPPVGPVPDSPPCPPPAGTVGSANFPPPVPGSPSPPASLPVAAVALAPGGGQWRLSQSPGRNARQLGGQLSLTFPLPVSPGCEGSWPPPLAAYKRRGDRAWI